MREATKTTTTRRRALLAGGAAAAVTTAPPVSAAPARTDAELLVAESLVADLPRLAPKVRA
jgi:hypothetical protein